MNYNVGDKVLIKFMGKYLPVIIFCIKNTNSSFPYICLAPINNSICGVILNHQQFILYYSKYTKNNIPTTSILLQHKFFEAGDNEIIKQL